MPLKSRKPTTPGQRGLVLQSTDDITTRVPKKSLLLPVRKRGGRNSSGRLTVRHRGGGHKRRLRIIDFKRDKSGVPGEVVSCEYDPNRSARIALIKYRDGDWRYILAPNGLKVGDQIEAGEKAEIRLGNALPLRAIPAGTLVHNVELKVGKGGQVVRSAGSSAQVLAKEDKYTLLRLPSGEMRYVLSECMATVGQVSAIDPQERQAGQGRPPTQHGLEASSKRRGNVAQKASSRRRRRQVPRGDARAQDALGKAGPGVQDAKEQVHR